jgi:addiction module RelB/DinJ family antitoxin
MPNVHKGVDMSTKMVTMATRINPEVKEGAARVVESIGLDLSSVVRAFTTQIYLQQRVPLDLSKSLSGISYPLSSLEPNALTIESMREADDFIASGALGRFTDASEMFENLGI